MKLWSHLPNARHIDALLAIPMTTEVADAITDAYNEVRAAHTRWDRPIVWRTPETQHVLDHWRVWIQGQDSRVAAATYDALVALVHDDAAGYLLDTPVDAVKVLAASNVPNTIAMLPMCIMLSRYGLAKENV